MIKKSVSLVLSIVLAASLCACGNTNPTESTQATEGTQATEATQATQADPVEYSQVASGPNGCVSAADAQAAQVGMDILQAGGNAADAAVATAFALGLTESAASGIGGAGMMLYYDAATKKTSAVNYYYECPENMALSDFENQAETRESGLGGLRTVVPGFVAGMCEVNERFGTKPLAELIQPTIDLAEEGVPVTSFMAENFRDTYEIMLQYPETLRVFTNDGLPFGEGDIFKNPDLAKTLRIIAEQGKDGFYKGEVAEAIVESQAATGSKLTLEDLANYHVQSYEPLSTTYHGYNIVTMPAPCGGAIVLNALNMAEHFDIAGMERGSKEYLHTWTEIFHVALSDYSAQIEDPDFYDQSNVRGLITKEYANERVKLINPDKAFESVLGGDPENYDPESHTTHLSVVDKDGNMVSMTNTNNDWFGGMTTVTDYGFVVLNTGAFFTTIPSYYPEAGKRARVAMTPTFIFNEDGTPYAAVGTPGGMRIITTISLIISNMIDYKMDLKSAMDAPRLYKGRTGELELEGGFDEKIVKELEAMGHTISVRVANDSHFGGAHCIVIDPVTGEKTGVADIRRSGAAIAY